MSDLSNPAQPDEIAPPRSSAEEAIERYLQTGDSDMWYTAWPGDDFFARARAGRAALRRALVEEVHRRAPAPRSPVELTRFDRAHFTREKVAPMVRGLFPAIERERVLGALADSVVFLTPDRIAEILTTTHWPRTAWNLANLYLLSAGAEPLAEDAPRIVGMSEETTCFVSMEYFQTSAPLADFVVHEAAHVFHNCKRETVGLPATRRREWLLDIAFGKRETFAYACEAYSRLLELGDSRAARQALLDEHAAGPLPPDEQVDPGEYLGLLRSVLAARNGWKRILQGCSPPKSARS